MMNSRAILKKYWGYEAFRPLQEEIIQSVLQGRDTLALMPTGGGKSICFQVPALQMEGICIVVSPLIALMKDQVEHLQQKGISAIAIYAGMGKREIDILLDNCVFGPVKFLYLSPERLLSELVRTRISYMNVNLIAVDEAHCISQWGYDFRPPYLQLSALREIHPQVPVVALTATATTQVRTDILEQLAMKEPLVFIKSFARKNLSYVVLAQEDKYKKLMDICRNVKGCGLVYVRNRRETTEVALFLQRNGISADFYHAGLEKDVRFARQENWKKNITRIMVATNAFGMGIDKPDVRFVVHLDLPESLEAYYQEAGRAGRDEHRAYAVLLANSADRLQLKARYQDAFPTVDEIKTVYHQVGSYFQLAYGAGEGLSFAFDLAAFCKQYQLSVLKTMAALEFLERDGYLAVSESVFLSSRVMFIASHEDVYRFQIENIAYDLFIKTILRSYGGVFDQYVPVRESDLAHRCKMSFKEVVIALNRLQQLQLLSYLPQTDQPQLQFLVPRADRLHLDLDVKFIRLRKEVQEQQIEAVLAYSEEKKCRSRQLLAYFGEIHAERCGTCDVCLEELKAAQKDDLTDQIEFEIMTALQSQPPLMDELMSRLRTGTSAQQLERIRLLLDSGRIYTDGKRYYLPSEE